jgi:hypothetical protein
MEQLDTTYARSTSCLGLILLQAGQRNTARHSLLARSPLLVAPPRSVERPSHATHRCYSDLAFRSPPQDVPRLHVELYVQSCRREQPHRGVLRRDIILVSASGASTMTAFSDGSPVQPNRPRASPHPRPTHRPVNRRRRPVDWPLTGGSPSPDSRHHCEASLVSPVLPAAPKRVTSVSWSPICSPPLTSLSVLVRIGRLPSPGMPGAPSPIFGYGPIEAGPVWVGLAGLASRHSGNCQFPFELI